MPYGYESEGWEFEPLRARHYFNGLALLVGARVTQRVTPSRFQKESPRVDLRNLVAQTALVRTRERA